MNSILEPILFNFALDKPLRHEQDKKTKINITKIIKQITFYLETVNQKPADFNVFFSMFFSQLINA